MKVLLPILTTLVLCGCFLTPSGNTSPQAGKALVGKINMIDLQGKIYDYEPKRSSYVWGIFGRVKESATFDVVRSLDLSRETTDPVCGVDRIPLSSAATAQVLSVGKVLFNSKEMKESEQHDYMLAIDKDYPAGMYKLSALGAGDAPGFTETISLPEAFHGAKVDGADMATEGAVIKHGEGLKFEWDTPKDRDKPNFIVLVVNAYTKTDLYQGYCQLVEADLANTQGQTLSYTMDQSYIAALPNSTDVEIQIQRIHQTRAQNVGVADNRIYGMRAFATKGIIED